MHIPKLDSQTILLALAAITGLAMFLQVFILLGIFVSMRKAAGSIRKEIGSLRASIMPVIFDTQELLANSRDTLFNTQEFIANAQAFLTRVSPKVEAAAGDLVEITKGLKAQTALVQLSVQEIVDRVRKQSNRVDNMVTGVLDTADRAGGFVNDVVARPVRQVSGILAAIKAIVESLRGSGAQPR
jgi:methyl-accepting chemotaxis protein